MSWFSRLKNSVDSNALDEELRTELQDHLDRRTAELIEQGVGPGEARRLATLRFGNTTNLRERSREFHLWSALDSVVQDVRYAWRGMKKHPAFTATAVLSLSLAIGANTAIYSIVDAAMLRPLPVADPGRLFTLASNDIEQPGDTPGGERETFNYPLYQALRAAAGGSAQLGLFSYANREEARIAGASNAREKVTRQFVSGDAFEMLRVSPSLGRLFSAADDRVPGAHPVAVLSYDYWHRRFGEDPSILGRRIEVEEASYIVVGVVRKGFFGIEPGQFIDVWTPAMMYRKEAFTNPGWGWFRIIGKLAPGSTQEQVTARLQPAFHGHTESMLKRNPSIPPGIREKFLAMTLHANPAAAGVSGFRQTFERPLWIVLGVAAGILLIACANVASLLLARATARSAEMAMRVSLGASRRRLMRQLLTESLTLSVLAGGIGWLFARWAAPVLISLLSTEGNPVRFALTMDTRVLLFCVAVSTLAAIVFGLAPAWQSAAVQPMVALRSASGQAGKLRMGRFFVVVQVAFAFCLVMAGAGFLFSLRNLFAVDAGFDPHGITVLSVSNDLKEGQAAAQHLLMENLQRRVAALPGVESIAMAPYSLYGGSSWTDQVIVPGRPRVEQESVFYMVSPGYFRTLRTKLLTGRDFESRDSRATEPIPTVVNPALARKFFGDANVLGREFSRPEGTKMKRHRIIGIAADSRYRDLRKGPEPMAYLPLNGESYFALYIRSRLDVGSIVHMVERETQALGSGARIREVTTLETLVGNTLLKEKLLAGIGGVFALLGLLLASIGLFGLLNYSVARRTKEIGIRAALGAQRLDLIYLVTKDLIALVGGGLLAGLAASVALMSLLSSLLFGIRVADPLLIAIAISAFVLSSVAAAAFPAGRALAIDPAVALRDD